MVKRYTAEERQALVLRHRQGATYTELGVDRHTIHTWTALYDSLGLEGLRPGRRNGVNPQTKSEIMRDLSENTLTLRQIEARYLVARSTLKAWKKKALAATGSPRPSYGTTHSTTETMETKEPGKKEIKDMERLLRKRDAGEPLTEMERLKIDNWLLRAEVDMLKKLDALAREKRTRENCRRQ